MVGVVRVHCGRRSWCMELNNAEQKLLKCRGWLLVRLIASLPFFPCPLPAPGMQITVSKAPPAAAVVVKSDDAAAAAHVQELLQTLMLAL